jgi:thiamine biosynthesis lipoprotein
MPVSRHAHSAMSTEFELLLPGDDFEYHRQAAQAVFSEIDRLEEHLSRFDPRSDISQINRLVPGESLRVGIETFDCLDLSLRLQARTGGAFDIDFRSGRGRGAAGVPRSGRDRPDPAGLPESSPLKLHVLEDGFEVQVTHRVDLDLGGIGKGYALDRAATVLEDWDIRRFLFHGGTSTVLAKGSPGGCSGTGGPSSWTVGVGGSWECRAAPRRVNLEDRALSGSGPEVKGAHVYDPASGRPARAHPAAWASHPSAAVSDALSTAFMVMPTARVQSYCGRHPEVWALVICGPKTCKIFNAGILVTNRGRRPAGRQG